MSLHKMDGMATSAPDLRDVVEHRGLGGWKIHTRSRTKNSSNNEYVVTQGTFGWILENEEVLAARPFDNR